MKSLIKIAGAVMMLVFSAGLSMVSAQKHHHKHGKGHYKKVTSARKTIKRGGILQSL